MRIHSGILFLLTAVLAGGFGVAEAAGVTYTGRLVKSDGTPVVSPSVLFKLQIRTPGPEDCLLYEEQQTKNLATSNGMFAITINDGTATVVNTEPFTLDRVFQNRGTFNFGSGKCAGTTSYAPNPIDGRRLVVEFNDGTFAGWEQIPAQPLNHVPMALESATVGGFNAANLVRVVDGSGFPATVSPLTQTQHNALIDLANGVSTAYVTPAGSVAGFTGALAGDVTGPQGSTVVSKIQGRAVDSGAPSDGQTLIWSAVNSRWEPGTIPGGSGGDWTTLANKPASFTPSPHAHAIDEITSASGKYFAYQPNGVSCVAGEVLKWDAAGGGRWICGADVGGGTGTLTSLNGESGAVQVFGTPGTAGTAPNWASSSGTHTLNLPLASQPGVTAGLISKSQFDAFSAKLSGVTGSALGNGEVWIGNGSGLAAAVAVTGDVSLSNAGVTTVSRLQGTAVDTATPTGSGQVLKYSTAGTKYSPGFIGLTDLRSTVNAANNLFPVGCTSSQTLAYSAVSDTFSCADLTVGSANITDGSITAADLDSAVANGLWTASGANVYRASGAVGIGTATPGMPLDVVGNIRAYNPSGNTAFSVGRLGDGIYYNSINIYSGYNGTSPSLALSQDFQGSVIRSNLGSLRFEVGAGPAEGLRVLSTGNVGVGTTAAPSKLTLKGDQAIDATSVATGLTITKTQLTTGPAAALRGLSLNVNGSNDTTTLEGINATVASGAGIAMGSVAISGTSNNTIYANNGPGVGVIGTANQANMGGYGSAIGVKGVANGVGTGGLGSTYGGYFDNTTAVAGNNYGVYVNTTSSGSYGLYQAGGVKNYFSGAVGIGSTAPGANLDIAGGVATTTPMLNLSNTTNAAGGAGVQYGVKVVTAANRQATAAYGVYSLYQASNNAFTSAGVYGETSGQSTSGGVTIGVRGKSTVVAGSYSVAHGVYGEMASSGAGGTSTSYAGYFNNAATAGGTNYGAYVNATTGGTTTIPLAIAVDGSEKIRVDSSGSLGIGTTAPQSALQVKGYAQLDTVSGAPPSTDCDAAPERGRMKVDPASGALYVCMDSGWVNTAAGTPIPAGSHCGGRQVACYNSTATYEQNSSSNVACAGNTLTAICSNAGTYYEVVAVSGCPAGYTGRTAYMGYNFDGRNNFLIYCSKN